MLGRFDEAKKNLELPKAADDGNLGGHAMHEGYLGRRPLYILETGQWEEVPVEASAPGGEAYAGMAGMDAGRYT